MATVAQFWLVMLTEGDSDIEKHMLMVVFGTMLLGPLLFAALAAADQTVPGAATRAGRGSSAPRGAVTVNGARTAGARDYDHDHDDALEPARTAPYAGAEP